MNILNRYMSVLFRQYNKDDDDGFIGGFVARNILALIIMCYLAVLYLLLDLLALVPKVDFETVKEQKIVIFSILIFIRILMEFITKTNSFFLKVIETEENTYDDKSKLVWTGIIGLSLFFILVFLR